MKKFILSAVLATSFAGAAFAAVPLSDLVLGFRDDGSAGGTNQSTNLQIDLGAVTTFKSQAAGTTTVVTNLLSLGGNSVNTLFTGTNWDSNTGLKWGIAGSSSSASTRILWGTQIANSSLLNGSATTTAGLVGSSTQQSSPASKINTLYTNQSSAVYTVATNGLGAWSAQEAGTAAFGFAGFADLPTFENNTAVSGGYHASDLYEFVPSSLNPKPSAVYLGTFAIQSNGDVTFTAAGSAAVPEPSTYAVIAGAAVLGFVMIRRRVQGQQQLA